jgi:hypothetical protein
MNEIPLGRRRLRQRLVMNKRERYARLGAAEAERQMKTLSDTVMEALGMIGEEERPDPRKAMN